MALLSVLFGGNDKRVPASILLERLRRERQELEQAGEFSLSPLSPQRQLSDWVDKGWLSRRLPAGGAEEEYELTLDAARAIKHLDEIQRPRTTATESRLATVIQRAQDLAEKTDPDPQRRVLILEEQLARVQRELDQLRGGEVPVMDEALAAEGLRDLLDLVTDIPEDFHRVRLSFERLNAELRHSLVEHEGGRAEVLKALFEGKDLIAESDAGRTFAAFWGYLKDPASQARFSEALEALMERPFAKRLSPAEHRALEDFAVRLLREATEVQLTHQTLSQSLRSFVRTNQFRENRQVTDLIRRANAAAASLKGLRWSRSVGFDLTLTTSSLRTVGQLALRDPAERGVVGAFGESEVLDLSWEELAEFAASADIDFGTLRATIREALADSQQASVGELVRRFGAPQGLASVVGYLVLVREHGVVTETPGEPDEATWNVERNGRRWRVTARIPKGYFVKGWEHELGD